MIRLPSLVLALLVSVAAPVRADSWGPPQPLLANSEDGRWYVAFNPGETYSRGEVLLVRRAPGKPPRAQPERPKDFLTQAPPTKPEAGDVLLARIETHVPMQLRCLNDGKGFVLFDTYAWVGMGTVFARYDAQGEQLWTRKLGDFFTKAQIETFRHTVSSIWWSRGLWIDEERWQAVVVYDLDGLRLLGVDLRTGQNAAGDPASVLGRIGKGTLAEQVLALEVAAQLRPAGTLEVARAQFARTDLPLAVRIRLAVLMAREGDHRGDELVLQHVAEGQPTALRQLAVRSLPVLLGEDALPRLRELMRGKADDAWHPAMEAFRTLGAKAVPTLIEMLGEEGESIDYRGGAAHVLGDLGDAARPAVPALLAAARTAPEHVANAALNALVNIVPPAELGPRLILLLAAGTNDDGRIALWFQEHPQRDAVRALEVARARHADDEKATTREWIDEALARCRRAR